MQISLLLFGAVALLSSCKKEAADCSLQHTRWMLTQVEDFNIMASSYAPTSRTYVEFSTDNKTAGLTPCNSFSGTYLLGAGAQLSITAQASTRVACSVQSVEDRYLAAFPRTARYAISRQELRLYDASSTQPILIFRAAD
jgi:heat shock protein HslJ